MKKRIVAGLLLALLLTGCSAAPQNGKEQQTTARTERKERKGEVRQVVAYQPSQRDCVEASESFRDRAVPELKKQLEDVLLSVSGAVREVEQKDFEAENLISDFSARRWRLAFEELDGTVFHEVDPNAWKRFTVNTNYSNYECELRVAFWNADGSGFRMEQPVMLTKLEQKQLDYSNAEEACMGIWFSAKEGEDAQWNFAAQNLTEQEIREQLLAQEQWKRKNPLLKESKTETLYAKGEHIALSEEELAWYEEGMELYGFDNPKEQALHDLSEEKVISYLAKQEKIAVSDEELEEYGYQQMAFIEDDDRQSALLKEVYGSTENWWKEQKEAERLALVRAQYMSFLRRRLELEEDEVGEAEFEVYAREQLNRAIGEEQIFVGK